MLLLTAPLLLFAVGSSTLPAQTGAEPVPAPRALSPSPVTAPADPVAEVRAGDEAAEPFEVAPATTLYPRTGPTRGRYPTGARYGIDVSWPQCGTELPTVAIDFVVVGLTDGHAESVNPCLAEQAAWTRDRGATLSLYVVPNSPSAQTLDRARAARGCAASEADCVHYRAGQLQARHALNAARAARVHARTWWLDVEESVYGTLWGEDLTANVAILRGWADELTAAGHRVGVYSTGGYWSMITGEWETNLPAWVAVGESGIEAARERCAEPFSAGPVVIAQWLTGPLDGNLVCPGAQELAGDLLGAWTRPRTAGVPELLLIPVPHPRPVLEDETEPKKRGKDPKAADRKRRPRPDAGPQPAPDRAEEPTRAPRPQPAPAPKPSPKPSPQPSPKPSPQPEPSPAPLPEVDPLPTEDLTETVPSTTGTSGTGGG